MLLRDIEKIFIPTKPIREGKVGDYVRINSEWYGKKTSKQFNLGVPKEGEIVKINPSSVSVKRINGEIVKFPAEAKITNDLNQFKGMTKLEFDSICNKAESALSLAQRMTEDDITKTLLCYKI